MVNLDHIKPDLAKLSTYQDLTEYYVMMYHYNNMVLNHRTILSGRKTYPTMKVVFGWRGNLRDRRMSKSNN